MAEDLELAVGRGEIIKLTLLQSAFFLAVALGYGLIFGDLSSIGLTTEQWEISLAAGMGLFVLAVPVLYLPRAMGYRNPLEEILATKLTVMDIVGLNFVVSLGEELFFRGFLIGLLGVIPSAVIFGLMHYIGYESWVEVVYALAVGLVLGFVFKYMLPNVLFPFIFHFLANTYALLLMRRRLQSQE
jgi:membrane protease YdiL (CAAX protease family)